MAEPGETFEPDPRAAAEWGLASVLIGGLFILAGPITLLLILGVGSSGEPHRWVRGMVIVAALAGAVVGVVSLALSAVGLIFGLWSAALARRHRQPTALGVSGVLLNAFAVFIWLGTNVAWHGMIWEFV